MENIVSARRLRKSFLNNNIHQEIDLNNTFKTSGYKEGMQKSNRGLFDKFKTKIILKLFFCSLILFILVMSKLFFLNEIKENSKIVRLYNHYSFHFSKEILLVKIERKTERLNVLIGDFIPGKIKNITTENYENKVKPFIINFKIKALISQFLEKDNKEEIIVDNTLKNIESNYIKADLKEEIFTGIGGAEPIDKIEKESSVNLMEIDVEEIRKKNISIANPTKGIISSRYGSREEIFAGVNPYHTGIDIANKQGTDIFSATKGIVTKVEYDNKYYGNFIEITEKDIVFKYAHLDKIIVNQGNLINQIDKIGTMGSTGMSTGPHLHFEIRINNRSVDPEYLLNF